MRTIGQWTLDELVDRVAAALAAGYLGQASGRVRDLPDRRAVRYYTTLGLVDRPSGWRGRVALYGERHLVQLTAIKRLQALGLSLAEVQAAMTGADEATLRRLATPPGERPAVAAAGDAPPPPGAPAASPARRRFWATRQDGAPASRADGAEPAAPADPATGFAPDTASDGASAVMSDVADDAADDAAHDAAHDLDGVSLQGVGLAPGVILLVEGDRPVRAGDLAALRGAARPLLATIQRLGLQPTAGQAPAPPRRASSDPTEGDDR